MYFAYMRSNIHHKIVAKKRTKETFEIKVHTYSKFIRVGLVALGWILKSSLIESNVESN